MRCVTSCIFMTLHNFEILIVCAAVRLLICLCLTIHCLKIKALWDVAPCSLFGVYSETVALYPTRLSSLYLTPWKHEISHPLSVKVSKKSEQIAASQRMDLHHPGTEGQIRNSLSPGSLPLYLMMDNPSFGMLWFLTFLNCHQMDKVKKLRNF